MIHFQDIKNLNRETSLLILSMLLLLIKGLVYIFIGVIYPLGIGLLLLLPLLYGYLKGGKKIQKAVKYWSVLVICYGLIRILLNAFIYVDDSGVPSGAYYQFTVWYGLKSISYVILGIYLFIQRKEISFQQKLSDIN